MKFQNPSLNFFLNGGKDGRTNERTSPNQYAPYFFKVGGKRVLKCGQLRLPVLSYCHDFLYKKSIS